MKGNEIIECGDYAKVILHGGYECLISIESIPIVARYTWCREGTGYAMSYSGGKAVKMHRIIMNAAKGEYVDHINGNTLDNRLCNLRICTKQQNEFNQKIRTDNTSGYRGVSKGKHGKFRATINYCGRQIRIGEFITIEEAAKEYNSYAFLLYGEYARLNVIRNPAD